MQVATWLSNRPRASSAAKFYTAPYPSLSIISCARLQIAPELFRALMPEDEGESGGGNKKKGGKSGRPRSGALDAFDMAEPISEEEALQMELEKVKIEREKLLLGIAACQEGVGTAGAEAQELQIAALLQELHLKKAKVNELKLEAARKELDLAKRTDENKDCQLLTPDGAGPQLAYIEALKAEAENLIISLEDADAKNRLYQLLSDRTKCVAVGCCITTGCVFCQFQCCNTRCQAPCRRLV